MQEVTHMKTPMFIVLASALYAGAALAQTASPPAAPAPAETAPTATAPIAAGAKQKPKEVLASCREEAKSQGLKGDARKTAVQECVVKQRPDLAAWEKCRTDPEMKGNPKDERKALMKECLKNNKS
jgi:hypothetical protein